MLRTLFDILIDPAEHNQLLQTAAIIFWAPGIAVVRIGAATPLSDYIDLHGIGAIIIAFWLNVACLPITGLLALPFVIPGLLLHREDEHAFNKKD